jgi:hypothetical protein
LIVVELPNVVLNQLVLRFEHLEQSLERAAHCGVARSEHGREE